MLITNRFITCKLLTVEELFIFWDFWDWWFSCGSSCGYYSPPYRPLMGNSFLRLFIFIFKYIANQKLELVCGWFFFAHLPIAPPIPWPPTSPPSPPNLLSPIAPHALEPWDLLGFRPIFYHFLLTSLLFGLILTLYPPAPFFLLHISCTPAQPYRLLPTYPSCALVFLLFNTCWYWFFHCFSQLIWMLLY